MTRACSFHAPIRIALLFAAALLSACSREQGAPPASPARLIVVISVDTLRSDHLPAYGYDKVQTPAIDSFRRDAVLYQRAYAHVPLTLPSHATIFTGLLPAETGIRDNAGFKLTDGVKTLAEILKERGYATGAAVSAYSLRGDSGIGRGFDLWEDRFADASSGQFMGEVQRDGAQTVAITKEWIRANRAAPSFFFLHLYEPHTPYQPTYDAEIAQVDSLLGDFFQFLREEKLYDDAAIIFLSDHGEGLDDHGEDEHGILLYREAIQVPLLLKLPKSQRKGSTVSPPVQLIDVFPTVLELAGTRNTEPGTRNQSLLEKQLKPRDIFSETYFPRLHLGWSEQHSIVRGDHHLIDGPQTELYNLSADPVEKNDVSATERRTRAALLQAIAPLRREANPTASISPEEASKLQALGYLGSPAASGTETLPDPKVIVEKFREVRQAIWFFENQRYTEAVAMTDRLLESNGRMFDVWDIRARSLAQIGRTDEALNAAQRAMSLFPASTSLAILIAELSLQSGRLDAAAEHARIALDARPAEAHDVLARVALSRGDLTTADAEAKRAAVARPDDPAILWTQGRIAAARNQRTVALTHFDRAVQKIEREKLPPLRNLQQDRGFLLATLGRTREAEAAFKAEIQDFPQEPTAWSNLLILYRSNGRPGEAAELLQRWVSVAPRAETYTAIAETLTSLGDRAGAAEWSRRRAARFSP